MTVNFLQSIMQTANLFENNIIQSSFTVNQKIIVSDPCYDPDGECNYIANVKPGKWHYIVIAEDNKPKEVIVFHSEFIESAEWKLVSTDICVDSSLVGFYDLDSYQAKNLIKNEDEAFELQRKWFLANENGTADGCIIKTRYPNGCYDLYSIEHEGLTQALKLILLPS